MPTKRIAVDNQARLSLVAQFDDISRLVQQLNTGSEKEFIQFVLNQNAHRFKWSEATKENALLKKKLLDANEQYKALETQKKHLRLALETADGKRHKIEEEKRSLERQISIIKEVLLSDQNALNNQTKEKLAFLDTPLYEFGLEPSPRRLDTIEESVRSCLSSLEVSFDKTNENLDNSVTSGKRRFSERHHETEVKKPRLEDDSMSDRESSYSDRDYNTIPKSQRCFSEPVPSAEHPATKQVCKSDNILIDDLEFVDEQTKPVFSRTNSTPVRRLSSTGAINRNHVFCNKTVIRPEICYPCGGRIGFYRPALKCQDCKVTCHPECKSKVPLPCYPAMHTPTNKGILGLADFVPTTPPMIPPLLVHCIGEIESRGLTEIGVYRVSGAEREVKDLKEKFLKGKNIPCLSKIDIHAICGTVKEFLRSLPEPLLTKSLRSEFVSASEMRRKIDQVSFTRKAIDRLPRPNKDTLAFLIIHLNKIAESPLCKMPKSNLSKVFGPTIVGYSSGDFVGPSADSILAETKHQCKIVDILLSIHIDYWNSILGICETEGNSPPQSRMVQQMSRRDAFSVYASPCKKTVSQGVLLGKTHLHPRNNSTRPKRFFNSPLLK